MAAAATAAATWSRPRTRLLKTHECGVTYPDGGDGRCTYERLGPRWHLFCFRYADGTPFPRQYWAHELMNCVETIEQAAQAQADSAFAEAIEKERLSYFARATEPSDGSRKKDPKKYRLPAGKAKKQGGMYALCLNVGSGLFPLSRTFKTLKEANAAWAETGDPKLFVACCNRLDRCWEIPRFNPLYKEHPELKQIQKEEKEEKQTPCPSC